ncbi:hypothetical protein EIN_224350 [Entamoeba invadens IP1]|uniref:Rho-GAP domain-containing protein n=2 Tax=Entamoeba invadens TaxID=33085 RepID=A0A0A1U2A8_ENTIV|nr:hypothetical protein EIN_224350 [Entamoeba invadens IP1]ELP88192.1 hypothetical protein EIN_224350 [Entamoeba invadens IP1]BAN42539.1 hypothetical protein [Entamoeba invadens]|eukprot:XP_004254963.1 hypothetical protein EIN_224350 [Entamoeba invadens IP1]
MQSFLNSSPIAKISLKQFRVEYTTTQYDFSYPTFTDNPPTVPCYNIYITESDVALTKCPKKDGKFWSSSEDAQALFFKMIYLSLELNSPKDVDSKSVMLVETKPFSKKILEIIFKSKDNKSIFLQKFQEYLTSTNAQKVFLCPLYDYHIKTHHLFPPFVKTCLDVLSTTEAPFYLETESNELFDTINAINNNSLKTPPSFSLSFQLLKYYFRALPSPLIQQTQDLFDVLKHEQSEQIQELKIYFSSIEKEVCALLAAFFQSLNTLSENSVNHTTQSLSSYFTLALSWDTIKPTDKRMFDVVQLMIKESKHIFPTL